ncbi:MAG: DUF58 domain-containing protein [Oscillospiraceae bacterium]|nr:DUF58 domain-containing protein [Oscillospiraceae bacterium]
MWRRRILYTLALLLAYLGQILDVGYLFHFIFFAVLALPLLGLLLSLPAMLGCRAELVCSAPRVFRGETASWSLQLDNRFHLPLARASCRLRVSNRMTGEAHRDRAVLRGMTPEEDRSWTLETDHCGAVDCQVEGLWVCDCLGLFALPVRPPRPSTLLTVPLPEEPGAIELPEGAGAAAPQPKGKTVFGENYELRPYREGDSLRMVHWKMTAKRDELVTREPPEDTRPLPVLTFDHFGPLAQVDRALDRLEGYSLALLDRERPHEVRWAHPETGAVRIFQVAGERDWEICLAAILSDPAPLRGRSILSEALARGSSRPVYQIHVSGKEDLHGKT